MVDDIDKILIRSLVRNGRATFTELAKKVNLSVTAVKSRFNTLINQKKIIQDFKACVNFEHLGYSITAFVAIEVVPMERNEVIKSLSRIPNIIELYEVTGLYDLVVKIVAKDMSELRDILSVTLGNIPGIKKTYTMIIIREMDLTSEHIDSLLWGETNEPRF